MSFTVGGNIRQWSVWMSYNSIVFEWVKKKKKKKKSPFLSMFSKFNLQIPSWTGVWNVITKSNVNDEVLHVLLCPFYPVPGHSNFCGSSSVCLSVGNWDPFFFMQFNLTLYHRRILQCSKHPKDIQDAFYAIMRPCLGNGYSVQLLMPIQVIVTSHPFEYYF